MKVSGQPEALAPVLVDVAWSHHWKLASRAHPCLPGELCACLGESSIWGHDVGICTGLGGPWEAAREGEVGHGVVLPVHQAGARSADPGKGSGRSAGTGEI